MSPLHPVAPRKSQDTISVVSSSSLSYYPITEADIQVIIVLWVLFLVTSIFAALRLYSRVKILQFYALEDYLYNVAFVSYPHFWHFKRKFLWIVLACFRLRRRWSCNGVFQLCVPCRKRWKIRVLPSRTGMPPRSHSSYPPPPNKKMPPSRRLHVNPLTPQPRASSSPTTPS